MSYGIVRHDERKCVKQGKNLNELSFVELRTENKMQ